MSDELTERVIKNVVADARAVASEARQKGQSILMFQLQGTAMGRGSGPVYEPPAVIEAIEAEGWHLDMMTQTEIAPPFVKTEPVNLNEAPVWGVY